MVFIKDLLVAPPPSLAGALPLATTSIPARASRLAPPSSFSPSPSSLSCLISLCPWTGASPVGHGARSPKLVVRRRPPPDPRPRLPDPVAPRPIYPFPAFPSPPGVPARRRRPWSFVNPCPGTPCPDFCWVKKLLSPRSVTICCRLWHAISPRILLHFECMICRNVHHEMLFISFHCAMLV